jgi:putative transposase
LAVEIETQDARTPPIDKGIRDLIRRMARDNPLWGAPHICSELHLLGYDVAQATVSKSMPQRRTSPSQTWRTFPDNHVQDIVAIDFFTVPTLTFRVLYGFLVLRHDQRMVVHFNATEHPTAQWVAQQIVEAFPFDEAPRFLLRDRDAIYGAHFQQRVRNMGTEAVVIAPQSPWQNPYAERMIGTLRHELLDHVIVRNHAHLCRLVASFLDYDHTVRPPLSLKRNAPMPRPKHMPSEGQVVAIPCVGGLHYGYRRVA